MDSHRRFRVTITETLKRTVEVEANDQQEAVQMVSDGWYNGEYIIDNVLDADNTIDVGFEAVPVEDGQYKPPLEFKDTNDRRREGDCQTVCH